MFAKILQRALAKEIVAKLSENFNAASVENIRISNAETVFKCIKYLIYINCDLGANALLSKYWYVLSDEQRKALGAEERLQMHFPEDEKHTNDRLHRRLQLLEGYSQRAVDFETVVHELKQANKSNELMSQMLARKSIELYQLRLKVKNAAGIIASEVKNVSPRVKTILEILKNHL